jgi:hypothetical protein
VNRMFANKQIARQSIGFGKFICRNYRASLLVSSGGGGGRPGGRPG